MPALLDWVILRPFDQVSKRINRVGMEGDRGLMKIAYKTTYNHYRLIHSIL